MNSIADLDYSELARSMIKRLNKLIKKYSVLICLATSVILIFIASLFYPGGSLPDKDSIGFNWSKNFLSNLFATKAMNGSANPGWIWAVVGMAFHSLGYGIFFIHMSKRITPKPWSTILKTIGAANLVFIFLIATPLHDLGTISIVLTLVGLFIITVYILKSKLYLLKIFSIVCLSTYYLFFFTYSFGYLDMSIIMQKVYITASMLLAIVLEYGTSDDDFKQIKWGKQHAIASKP